MEIEILPGHVHDFTLNSSGPSACPLISGGASGPGTLGASQSCTLPVSFSPSGTGTFNGSLVISDTSLNSTTSQTIQLSGTGTDSDLAQRDQPLDGACVPVPTIVNVSPATWFAGKTYHVTITGYNFLTAQTYCDPNHSFSPAGVQVTSSKNSVSVLNYQILSSSLIQATIQVGGEEPTADAQLIVSEVSLAFGPIRPALKVTTTDQELYVASMAPVQILGTPQIKWNDQNVTAAGCTLNQNQTLSGDSSLCAVVGQRISLTTDVASDSSIQITSNSWSVSSSPIASYSPSTESATVTPFINAPTAKTAQYYWAYPGTSSASYSYCTTIVGISEVDEAPPNNGNCSSTAVANFTVKGVQSPSITVRNSLIASVDYLLACEGHDAGMWLDYGHLKGPCLTPSTGYGILFVPTGSAPDSGNMFFTQIIDSDSATYSTATASTTTTSCPGVDGSYPYQGNFAPAYVGDAPGQPLPDLYITASRTFNARMYLMWQSSTSNSIPVALGYVAWTFQATARQTAGVWTATGFGGPYFNGEPGDTFVPSDPGQTSLGLPTWSSPVHSCTSSN